MPHSVLFCWHQPHHAYARVIQIVIRTCRKPWLYSFCRILARLSISNRGSCAWLGTNWCLSSSLLGLLFPRCCSCCQSAEMTSCISAGTTCSVQLTSHLKVLSHSVPACFQPVKPELPALHAVQIYCICDRQAHFEDLYHLLWAGTILQQNRRLTKPACQQDKHTNKLLMKQCEQHNIKGISINLSINAHQLMLNWVLAWQILSFQGSLS